MKRSNNPTWFKTRYRGNPASRGFVGPPSPFVQYFKYWHYSETRLAAYKMLKHAISCGMLPKARTLRCIDCNKWAHGWDHRDYKKPLQVDPVCAGCNMKRGAGLHAFKEVE